MPKRKAGRNRRGGAVKKGSNPNPETGTLNEDPSESVETGEEKSDELAGEQMEEVSTETLDAPQEGDVMSSKGEIEDPISIAPAIESLEELIDLVGNGIDNNTEDKCEPANVTSETLLTEQQEKIAGESDLDFCEVKGADDDEEEVQYIDEEADEEQQLLEVIERTNADHSSNILTTGLTDLPVDTDESKKEKDILIKNHNAELKSKVPDTKGNTFEEISEGSIDQAEQEEIINEVSSDVVITGVSFKSKESMSKGSKSDYKSDKRRVPYSREDKSEKRKAHLPYKLKKKKRRVPCSGAAESLEEVFFATENDDLKIPAEDKDHDYISDSSFSDHNGTNLSLEEISDDDLEPSKKRCKSLGPGHETPEVKVVDLDGPMNEGQSKIELNPEKGNETQADSNKRAASNEGDDASASKRIKISEEKDCITINDLSLTKTVVEDKDEQTKEGHSLELKTESQDKSDEATSAAGLGGKPKKEEKSPTEILKLRNISGGRVPAQFSKSDYYDNSAAKDYPDRYESISSSTQTESKVMKGKIVQCNINPIDSYYHSAKLEKNRVDQAQSSKLLNKFKHLLPSSIPFKVFTDITSIKSATKAHAYTFSMGPVTMSDMDSHEFRDVAVKGAEKFHLAFDTHCHGIFQSTLSNYENMATLIKKLKRLELGNRYMCMSFTYNFGQDKESEVWKATILFMYEQDIQLESMGLASDDKIRARLHLRGLPKGVSKDFINLLFPEALSVHTSSGIHEERVVTLGFSNAKLVEEILTCYDLVVVNGCQVKITKSNTKDVVLETESVEDADVMIINEDLSVEKCDVSMPVDILTETTDKAMQASQMTAMGNSESLVNKDCQAGGQPNKITEENTTPDYFQVVCKSEQCLDEVKEADKTDKTAVDKMDENEVEKTNLTTAYKIDETTADKVDETVVVKIEEAEADKLDTTEGNVLAGDAPDVPDLNVEKTHVQSTEGTEQPVDAITEVAPCTAIASKSDASLHELTSRVDEALKSEIVDEPSELVADQLTGNKDVHLEDVSDDDMMNQSKNTTLENVVASQESLHKPATLNIDLTNEDSDSSSNAASIKDSTVSKAKPSGQDEKRRENEKLVMTDGSLQVSMEVIDVSEDESSEQILCSKVKEDFKVLKSRVGIRSLAPKWKNDHWSSQEHRKSAAVYYPLKNTYSRYPPKEEYLSRPSPHYERSHSRELSYHRKVCTLEESARNRVPYRESTVRRRDTAYTDVRSRSPSPRKESSWYRDSEPYRPSRSHYMPDYYSTSSGRKYSNSGQQPYEKWQQYYPDSKKPEYYSKQRTDADFRPKDWPPRSSGHHNYSSWQGSHHGASKSGELYVHETKEPGYGAKKYPIRRSRSQSYSDMSSVSDHHSPVRRKWSAERTSPKRPLKHTSRSPISISSRSRSLSPVSKSPSLGRTPHKVPAKEAIVNTVKEFLHLAKDLRQSKRLMRSISPESCSPLRSRSPAPFRAHSPVHSPPSPHRHAVSRSHNALTHSSPRAQSRSPPPFWHRSSRSPDYSKSMSRHHRSPSPSDDGRSKRYKKHEYSDSRHDSYHRDTDSSRREYSRRSKHDSSPKEQTKTGQWSDQRLPSQAVNTGDQQWPPSYGSYQSKSMAGTPGGFNPNYPPPPSFPTAGYAPQETASVYQSGNMYQYSTPSQYSYTSMPPAVPNPYTTPAPVPTMAYQQQFSVFQSAMSSQPPPQQAHFQPSTSNKLSSAKNKKSWSMGSNAMVFQRILSNDGGKKQSLKKSGTIEKIGDRERQERPKQTKEVRVLTSVPVNER